MLHKPCVFQYISQMVISCSFFFVIFCGLELSLWMEKSLTCLHYKAYPNFPRGRSTGRATHATSCSCHGGKRALSTPQHAYSSGNYHGPWDWRPCHFSWLPQINARPCSADCSCIPPAWLWHAHLNCYFSVPVVAIQMKTLGYVRNEALGLQHTKYYILKAGHSFFLKMQFYQIKWF